MSKLILSLCLLTCLATRAQENGPLTLTNTWGKNSNLLYLGVENELQVNRQGQTVQAICPDATIFFNQDSSILKVIARLGGQIRITLTNGTDTLVSEYQVINLPLPSLSLGEGNYRASEIAPDQLEADALVHVTARGIGAEVFTSSRIRSYEIQIGERVYEGQGNALSSEMREAIHRAEGMATIILKKIVLEMPESGRTLELGMAKRYRVSKCGSENTVAALGR